MSRTGEGDFLSRWSRLKREGSPRDTQDQPAVTGAGAPVPEGTASDADAPERTDAEILEELGLPDPDTLGPGDDVRGFMASAVPARLRNRALRRLWVSNPVLACLDGLNDYDGDYTQGSTAGQVVRTLYRVGRGFVTNEEEAAARKAAGGAEAPQTEIAEPGAAEAPAQIPEQIPAQIPEGDPETAATGGIEGGQPPVQPVMDQGVSVQPRRRMVFRGSDEPGAG